ncbi:MAG: NADH-quinone oxidoreductase subunit F [Desulfobacterales bacterium]|nr:NADH-quinone oxidoreductase subunit F [Desulfobacterales bacterium]
MVPEQRIVTKNCGKIDPGNINSYMDQGGFRAYEKSVNQMSPEKIIEEIKASELKGRGGAGFSCGMKWAFAGNAKSDQKYLICNADEGEMGTFKDRYLLSNDPFALIEGMAIAGHAIGAKEAYIYLRAEYHFLHDLLLNALKQAGEKGFLKHLDIKIVEGAGAYICGEESALMNSIEGKRGEARFKPPFPPEKGLWEHPTIINNVETLMNIPWIMENTAEKFKKLGTENSRGTKLFSVSGDVAKPGVYELEMGSRLEELIVTCAGAENIKAVQLGGASGKILPKDQLATPLSFETVMGSGGAMVYNQGRDMVDLVHRAVIFLSEESCGKCTPCREGTEVMQEIFGRLEKGEGAPEDIENLESLSEAMMQASLCGLGQAAPVPVLDSLNHFRSEYEDRIEKSQLLRRLQPI